MALPRSIFTETRANRKDRGKRHKLSVQEEEATGRRVSNKLLRSALGSWLTKAGLRNVRFHDLRHTFASLLIQQETTPKYIRKKLGMVISASRWISTHTCFMATIGIMSIGSMTHKSCPAKLRHKKVNPQPSRNRCSEMKIRGCQNSSDYEKDYGTEG
jgi:hypothetical protein